MHPRLLQPVPALLTTLAAFAAMSVAAADSGNSVLETGKKLLKESKCEACHAAKVGGDGSAIYSRKDRRVTTLSKLLPQVQRCNSDLGLGLFPEDEAAIAAFLNATHYKFKE